MSNALIKFTGSVTGAGGDGEALLGEEGEDVTVENVDDTNVDKWQFELLYVPPDSALTTGVKQAYSTTPDWTFTPDSSECFVVRMRVKDASGNESVDDRVFAIAESTGRVIPPFKASLRSFNIDGNLEGWQPYLREYLKEVDRLSNLDPECESLTADFTTTSATAADTPLNVAIEANEVKLVRFAGVWSSQDANGVDLSINAPAGATIEGMVWGNGTTTTSLRTNRLTGTGLTSAHFSAMAGTLSGYHGWARVKNGATPGVVRKRVASVTAGQTCTVKAGSWLESGRATEMS